MVECGAYQYEWNEALLHHQYFSLHRSQIRIKTASGSRNPPRIRFISPHSSPFSSSSRSDFTRFRPTPSIANRFLPLLLTSIDFLPLVFLSLVCISVPFLFSSFLWLMLMFALVMGMMFFCSFFSFSLCLLLLLCLCDFCRSLFVIFFESAKHLIGYGVKSLFFS